MFDEARILPRLPCRIRTAVLLAQVCVSACVRWICGRCGDKSHPPTPLPHTHTHTLSLSLSLFSARRSHQTHPALGTRVQRQVRPWARLEMRCICGGSHASRRANPPPPPGLPLTHPPTPTPTPGRSLPLVAPSPTPTPPSGLSLASPPPPPLPLVSPLPPPHHHQRAPAACACSYCR